MADLSQIVGNWVTLDGRTKMVVKAANQPFHVTGSLSGGVSGTFTGTFNGALLEGDLGDTRGLDLTYIAGRLQGSVTGPGRPAIDLDFQKDVPTPPPPAVGVHDLVGWWRSDANPIGDPMETLHIEEISGPKSIRGTFEDYSRSFTGPCSADLNGEFLEGSVGVITDASDGATSVRRPFTFEVKSKTQLTGRFLDSPNRFTLTKFTPDKPPTRAVYVCYDYAVWRMTNFGQIPHRMGARQFEQKLQDLKYRRIAYLPAPFPNYKARFSQLPMNDGDVFYVPGTHAGYVFHGGLDHFLMQLHPKAPCPVAVSQLGLTGNIYNSGEAKGTDTTLRGNMCNIKRHATFQQLISLQPGGVHAYEKPTRPPPINSGSLEYYSLKGFKPQPLWGSWTEEMVSFPAHLHVQSASSSQVAGSYRTRVQSGDTETFALAGGKFDGFELTANLVDGAGKKVGAIRLALTLGKDGFVLDGVTVPGVTGNPKTFRKG